MKFASRISSLLLCAVLQLAFIQPTYQYLYSCNSSAPCGCSANSASLTRIVGGEAAGTSTWGWAVSISINNIYLCGGSILSSSWIITAAHCVNGVTASRVTVYAGSNTRFSGQSRVASSITVHPNYNSDTEENDIALIQLSSPITMSSSSVSVICLPSISTSTLAAGEWPPAGLNVVAVGWGTLSEGGSLPSALQQVTLQTIDRTSFTCAPSLTNSSLQFCAGIDGGGKDTCQGDSGGPLMMFTASNQWELVGLTSYGQGCAEANFSGVYTRVAYYQDWIRTTTSSAYTNPTSSLPASTNTSLSTSTSRSSSTSGSGGTSVTTFSAQPIVISMATTHTLAVFYLPILFSVILAVKIHVL